MGGARISVWDCSRLLNRVEKYRRNGERVASSRGVGSNAKAIVTAFLTRSARWLLLSGPSRHPPMTSANMQDIGSNQGPREREKAMRRMMWSVADAWQFLRVVRRPFTQKSSGLLDATKEIGCRRTLRWVRNARRLLVLWFGGPPLCVLHDARHRRRRRRRRIDVVGVRGQPTETAQPAPRGLGTVPVDEHEAVLHQRFNASLSRPISLMAVVISLEAARRRRGRRLKVGRRR